MKNKIKKIQILRIGSQIIFLFLLPGLFTLIFSELKNIYLKIIKGDFNIIQAYPSLIEFVTIIFLTIILGRFFCGWFCAFGAFNDFIHLISKNIFKVNFKVNEKLDALLKYVKYVILLTIVIVVWTMKSKIFQNVSPWDAFAGIITFSQVIYNLTIGFIILIFIAIGAMFIERFFCRYLCPLGAVFTLASKISIFKINKPNETCGECRLCTNNCSMGLLLYKINHVHGDECIGCLKCVETCPRRNIEVSIFNQNINPILASSVAIAGFAAVYSVNNLAGAVINKNNLASQPSISKSVNASDSSNSEHKNKYKDGIYTGNSKGIEPSAQVSVTIKNGKIIDIKTVQTDGTPGYYDQAKNAIPNEIIKAQSTKVDVVSGATYSCQGIISGVEDALKQAKEM